MKRDTLGYVDWPKRGDPVQLADGSTRSVLGVVGPTIWENVFYIVFPDGVSANVKLNDDAPSWEELPE